MERPFKPKVEDILDSTLEKYSGGELLSIIRASFSNAYDKILNGTRLQILKEPMVIIDQPSLTFVYSILTFSTLGVIEFFINVG